MVSTATLMPRYVEPRALLRALITDGRRTLRALAKDVELSEPAVRERMQRLERDGVITGYGAAVAPEAVDAGTAAFIALRFGPGEDVRSTVDEALRREPCVLEVHQVAGDDCYLIKVRVSSTGELAEVLDRIRAIPPTRAPAPRSCCGRSSSGPCWRVARSGRTGRM